MSASMLTGLLIVVLAGLLAGTMTWPMKVCPKLEFEHQWLLAMFAGLIVLPWIITLCACPQALDGYAAVGAGTILKANLFSLAWGVANVLFGICVTRLGAGLTFALLTGVGATIGVLTPTIFKGSGLFANAPGLGSTSGLTVLAASGVMLVGVVLTARAGKQRDQATPAASQGSRGFASGVFLAILAGFLSAGISFTFVFSQGPIVTAMTARGAGPIAANAAVWAIALLGGAAVNLLYPLILIIRKNSWHRFRSAGIQIAVAPLIGVQFFFAMLLLGKGMLLLGVLGASVGFGIQQGMQILGGQALGFASGEWRGAPPAATRSMLAATAVLLGAVALMAYGNAFSG